MRLLSGRTSALFARTGPAAAFSLVFFAVPIGILFAYSFGHATLATTEFGTSSQNYSKVVADPVAVRLLLRSAWTGALVAALCVGLAFPMAYAITLGAMRRRGELVLLMVLISLFSAYIVRVYAWRTVLGRRGLVNSGLEAIGLTHAPLDFLLYSRFAVVLTLVNVLLPLAVLPLYSALAGVDRSVIEAARSLGASPSRTLWRVTIPLASRGVKVAFAVCFIFAAGDYVTPQLVGRTGSQLIGNSIAQWFGVSFDWPLGSALAFSLVALMVVVIAAFNVLCSALGLRDRPA